VRLAALGFALGVWLLQQQPALPGLGVFAALCVVAALAGAGLIKRVPPVAAD
jgi:hypothetical protein